LTQFLAPSKDGWDCGRYGGGVHNGSIIKKDGRFYYRYRGEMDYPLTARYSEKVKTKNIVLRTLML